MGSSGELGPVRFSPLSALACLTSALVDKSLLDMRLTQSVRQGLPPFILFNPAPQAALTFTKGFPLAGDSIYVQDDVTAILLSVPGENLVMGICVVSK